MHQAVIDTVVSELVCIYQLEKSSRTQPGGVKLIRNLSYYAMQVLYQVVSDAVVSEMVCIY